MVKYPRDLTPIENNYVYNQKDYKELPKVMDLLKNRLFLVCRFIELAYPWSTCKNSDKGCLVKKVKYKKRIKKANPLKTRSGC